MATSGKNLSQYATDTTPSAKGFTFGIAVAEWNPEITRNLADGAVKTLLDLGAAPADIYIHWVPGSFELPLTAQWLIEQKMCDAVVIIGSVIQGETRHFDFVCEAVAQGVKDVSLKTNTPVIFCLLTDNTHQQAIDRSGGKHGNKGVECAVAAVKMATLRQKLSAED